MSLRISFSLIVVLLGIKYLKSDKCLKSDLQFKYTECDKTGHRWLVSVPKIQNKSCDSNSEFNIPKVARNCGYPCDPGTYLDTESQECQDCPSGTYSQGDTIEINNWQTLPPGFHTLSIDLQGMECKREDWIPKGDYISASVSQCESFLSFTASLYQNGELRFEYQMPEGNTYFVVKITHDECLSKTNDKSNIKIKYMDNTGASSWSTKTIPLYKGRNIITWSVTGSESDRSTVKIGNLRITSSIFSSRCTNCSAGYFSSKKSSICTPCSMNQYSELPGSGQCKECQAEQYSLPGSRSCSQKISCKATDYSYKWTACDSRNKRKKVFFWIQPMQCSETSAGSVKLPTTSESILCEPCPKGTFLNESLQVCQFCPQGTMTATLGAVCTPCSLNTKPVLSISYDKWSRVLPNLTVLCIKNLKSECKWEESWMFNGDHLQSSMTSDVHLLQLEFQTDDKSFPSNSARKSLFSFQFSLKCSGYCALHLYLNQDKFAATRINTWVNTTRLTESRHELPRNTSGRFIWYFSHHMDMSSASKSTDHVKIFSIQMTDLKNVGAIDCRSCDPNLLNNGCLDCDKGKYLSKETHRCEFCPFGNVLKKYPGRSIEDCVACGPGLFTFDGFTCLPNVSFTSKYDNIYDLSNFNGYHLFRGNNLFNTHGQQYVHVFNVTLFGGPSHGLSFCRNNISSQISYNNDVMYVDGVVEVTSPMCRITIVSDKSQNNSLYAIQAISLAEKYDKIEQSNGSSEYWKQINDSLSKNGFSGDNIGTDLHIYLSSDRKTDICTKGRETIVTLRCDKTLKESQFFLPSKCPVETCDGCNFHFLITSKFACPHCRLEDFTIINEECVGGRQKVHFQAPNYCVLKPGSQSTETIKCPLVTMRTAIVVIPTVFILIFLIGVVVYCYKKNKKLEYKYMRLIGGNEDNEQILAGAESCGMNDGDEEDDDVKIKTNSKSGKIFARFNKPNRNRNDYNDMETVNLNDNPEFDI